jgi:hypothetical protein
VPVVTALGNYFAPDRLLTSASVSQNKQLAFDLRQFLLCM